MDLFSMAQFEQLVSVQCAYEEFSGIEVKATPGLVHTYLAKIIPGLLRWG